MIMLTQEVERLNNNLRSKVEENRELENQNYRLTQEIEALKRKNQEYEITITQEWQSKILRYTQEIDEYKVSMGRYNQENEELRRRLQDLQEMNHRLAEYENTINLLKGELERLNNILRSKGEEINSLENNNRNLVQEIENLKRRNNEYEITITQQWETKWTRVTQENEELRRRLN